MFGISVVALGCGACSLLPFREKHAPTGTSYVGLGLSPLGLVAFPSQLCQAGQEFWEGGTRAGECQIFLNRIQHALKCHLFQVLEEVIGNHPVSFVSCLQFICFLALTLLTCARCGSLVLIMGTSRYDFTMLVRSSTSSDSASSVFGRSAGIDLAEM